MMTKPISEHNPPDGWLHKELRSATHLWWLHENGHRLLMLAHKALEAESPADLLILQLFAHHILMEEPR